VWTVGTANQIQFARDTQKCIELRNGGAANDTPVQVNDCNGSSGQTWTLELPKFLVFRFTARGKLDTMYAASKTLSASLTTTPDMVVQPDGAAVLVASTSTTIELVRFGADGQLDVNFGASLPTTLSAHSIARLPDGSFAVAVEDQGANVGVVRFTGTGALDTAFGTNGVKMVPASAKGAVSIAVDELGRIVLGVGTDVSMLFARILP
jgi:hypothetical protein